MNLPPYSNFPKLKTERLILDQITLAHLEEFTPLAVYSSHKELTPEQLILRTESLYQNGETINWGVFLNEHLVGYLGFYRGFKDGIGEIGFGLHPDYWGKAIMLEASLEVMKFGWETIGLNKITAYTLPENEKSKKLIKKLGLVPSGIQHEELDVFEIIR